MGIRVAAHIVTALLAVVLWSEALYQAGDSVLFAWERSTEGTQAESYDVVAVWEGASGIRQEFPIGATENLQMIVQRPRVGFFHFKVRAKNDQGEVSPWALSTDPEKAKVDGVPRGWRVYFELTAPPSGGIS